MSYKIGQFRRDNLNIQNYLTDLSYQIIPITTTADGVTGTQFTDYSIDLAYGNDLQYGNNYYIQLGFQKLDTSQTIFVNLQNSLEGDTNVQILNSFTIPAQDNSINQIAIVELAFSPNATYNQIVLTLQRTAYDYNYQNQQQTHGRLIKIVTSEVQVAKIYNILDFLHIESFRKIGVQGPPGLLMCINGQDIRIGPSGIYEIKNDYKIVSMGFIIKQSDQTLDKRDYFILDYQYKE